MWRWNLRGSYWIPAYEILEQHGFEVILVNARYAKNVPGRKTDVSDAAWLRQHHSYGLLRGSFRPDAQISDAARLSASAGAARGICRCPHPAHAKKGTVRNSVCEAIMMEGKGASYGY